MLNENLVAIIHQHWTRVQRLETDFNHEKKESWQECESLNVLKNNNMKEESVTKEKHFVGISMFQQHMVNDFFVYYRESTIREFLNYLRKKKSASIFFANYSSTENYSSKIESFFVQQRVLNIKCWYYSYRVSDTSIMHR